MFEVGDQSGGANGHSFGQRAVVSCDVFVRVPVASWEPVVATRPDLYEPNSPFQQPSCDQALAAEVVDFFGGIDGRGERGCVRVESIESEGVFGFAFDVECFGCGELQLCGEFVTADAGFESGIAG